MSVLCSNAIALHHCLKKCVTAHQNHTEFISVSSEGALRTRTGRRTRPPGNERDGKHIVACVVSNHPQVALSSCEAEVYSMMRVAATVTTDVADLGKGWHGGGGGYRLRQFSSQKHFRLYRVGEDQQRLGMEVSGHTHEVAYIGTKAYVRIG